MSQEKVPILEAILRACAQTAPHPWYPREHARQTGANADTLFHAIEWLWLEGLVQKAEGGETGPGITLTPLGERIVNDPDALDRVRRGLPVDETTVGGAVRGSLMAAITPVVTRLLLLANLAVFAWGALLASRIPGLFTGYLTGFTARRAYLDVLHQIGSVSAIDLVRGEWWRLLSCTFVHGGLLHLGMNMYALYAVGAFAEQTWGRWRYLAIYLIGGWGGSCVAMSYQTVLPLVGASGALCGILGAEAVWVLLYGRHLPRSIARRARTQMVTNLILVALMSVIPNVSWQAHLGGAIAGSATALVLHVQRFWPGVMRVLAVPAVVLVPLGTWVYLDWFRATTPAWGALEKRYFQEWYGQAVSETMRAAQTTYEKHVLPLAGRHPSRREPDGVSAAVAALEESSTQVAQLTRQLEQARVRNPVAEKVRAASLAGVQAAQALLDHGTEYLRSGKIDRRTEEARDQQEQDFLDAVEQWQKAAR